MKRYQPIAAVRPAQKGRQRRLDITWKNGDSTTVDLTQAIARSPHLAPLADWAFFALARVSPEGFAVEWTEDIELSAAQLWRWAGEQAGELMRAEDFRAWRERNRLSLTQAAEALGLSRRTVAYYDSGREPIPKTVLLATAGYDIRKPAA